MINVRVIPVLLFQDSGLVKTTAFKSPRYLGDPINIIRIFNDKGVNELVLLDISATVCGNNPRLDVILDVASECFMPLSYGGGIRDIETVRAILRMGVEKIVLNSYAVENPDFIKMASEFCGSQSVVLSVDVRKNVFGKYCVYTAGGRCKANVDLVEYIQRAQTLGAGEILINSIHRDGTMQGYDLELIRQVSRAVDIPVVACGGAGKLSDFADAVKIGGASAVAAGAFFVFHGVHRAVLINVPTEDDLRDVFV